MEAFDLAELNRVQHQTRITVTREPNPMPLIIDLVSVTDAIGFYD